MRIPSVQEQKQTRPNECELIFFRYVYQNLSRESVRIRMCMKIPMGHFDIVCGIDEQDQSSNSTQNAPIFQFEYVFDWLVVGVLQSGFFSYLIVHTNSCTHCVRTILSANDISNTATKNICTHFIETALTHQNAENNKNKTRNVHDGLVETYLLDDAYLSRVPYIVAPFRFGTAMMLNVIKISFIVKHRRKEHFEYQHRAHIEHTDKKDFILTGKSQRIRFIIIKQVQFLF